MRFMLTVNMSVEAGNEAAKAGKLGEMLQSIVDELKPEAAYFLADKGQRSAVLILNMEDASQIPAIAEPWFLGVNAQIELRPVMVLEDLMKAAPEMEAAVKKYG
jgi:hypothetical protein